MGGNRGCTQIHTLQSIRVHLRFRIIPLVNFGVLWLATALQLESLLPRKTVVAGLPHPEEIRPAHRAFVP